MAGGPVGGDIAPAAPLSPSQIYVLASVNEAFVQGLDDDELSLTLLTFLDEHDVPMSLSKVYERAIVESRRSEKRERRIRREQKSKREEAHEVLYEYISEVRSRDPVLRKKYSGFVGNVVDYLDKLTDDPGYEGPAPWERRRW